MISKRARFTRMMCLLAWMALATVGVAHAAPLGTAFTYQGLLKQSGVPLNNTADLECRLFDALSGGVQVGSTVPVNNVNVIDGVFTVSLDFGLSAFNGDQRSLPANGRGSGPCALWERGIFRIRIAKVER
jgi:hypothetical protein